MLNNKLKEVRTEIGMSVSELARRAGTTRQTIYNIEKKDHKDVSGMLMFSIAKALKKDVSQIFFIDSVQRVKQKPNSA
ncbi:helix-turn-helix transcriptional regulator [Evansella clarkii]|uniref:helix-turn-helix transcriptional regulator n=1 Tax=Evansella clarkii TaxID=79879 RepID=UPI0009967B76|nr:helix-turn-helix domain-containing protein [Evansella clarkii]